MDAKQLKYIELAVYNPDLNDTEIAKEVGVSRNTILSWKKKQEIKDEIRKEMDRAWEEMAKKAQMRMYQLMDSTNDSVALGASKYVMDSFGRNAVQKHEVVMDKIIGIENDNS